MEEESKPVTPPSTTASVPSASAPDHSMQAIILLVLLVPVALLTALDSLGNMGGILSGTPVVSEEGPVFRFLMALLTFVAAVAAIATACGAFWASRQEKKKKSEGDDKAADEASKLAKALCYFGWIVFACLTINLIMSFSNS